MAKVDAIKNYLRDDNVSTRLESSCFESSCFESSCLESNRKVTIEMVKHFTKMFSLQRLIFL